MGFLERIFHSAPEHDGRLPQPPAPLGDEFALERYRYMLQTASPETIEQAHAEAFESLTPEQRRQLLEELAHAAPPNERSVLERATTVDPHALARAATRAEIRQPGVIERVLGTSRSEGFGPDLLGSFAAAFAGSMVANAFFAAVTSGDDAALDAQTLDMSSDDEQSLGVSDLDDSSAFGGGDFES
jgi:hypothetical protein